MTSDTFEPFADALAHPALLATVEGRILGANTLLTRALALPRSQVRGCLLTEFVTEPAADVLEYLQLCSGSRQRVPSLLTFRPEGQPEATPYRCDGAAVRLPGSEQDPLVLLELRPKQEASETFLLLNEQIARLNREIHERKEAEAALQAIREQLEELVQERTARLEVINQELKRSNEALQRFAYVASHDLNEPLRKIETFGGMLRAELEDRLGEEAQFFLARMEAASGRMRGLIQSLLELSRVSTGRRTLAPVDLNVLIGAVLADLEPIIAETEAQLEVDVLPVLEADATQMTQLMQNLVSNALKFRRPDVRPEVHISSTRAGDGKEAPHRIVVEDNGIGFDNRFAEQIFQPFQRLHGRVEYEGTGIGLSICKQIAEGHGGTIEAIGHPGEGAQFIVTLPPAAASPHPAEAS